MSQTFFLVLLILTSSYDSWIDFIGPNKPLMDSPFYFFFLLISEETVRITEYARISHEG